MIFVGGDNRPHQRVTHHIDLLKMMKGNALGSLERLDRLKEATWLISWQINLGAISRDHTF